MNSFFTLALSFLCIIHNPLFAQNNSAANEFVSQNKNTTTNKKQLNFFIISKPKKLIDPATRYNMLRGHARSFFKHQSFVCIVANSINEMSTKVIEHLTKKNASIGSIWFDGHGNYKKGYSLFTIGNDEISYLNIADSQQMVSLKKIADYCTNTTKVGIGSCYAGATYSKPSMKGNITSRMNGDSLMIGLGNIFNNATIFACESWVMTKPGLFHKKYALEGHPQLKRFKDVVFEPVWENLWKWNEYNATTKCFTSAGPVTLDKYGNVIIKELSKTDKDAIQKVINKNVEKLEPGLYK